MTQHKHTPWYPDHIKPVRAGLYQVLMPDRNNSIEWCYWSTGWGWAYVNKRSALAKEWRNPEFATQSKVWRGLKEQS